MSRARSTPTSPLVLLAGSACPEDVNSLLPQLWSSGVSKDANGQLVVAGVGVRQLSEEVGTPAYVVDEADFRSAGPSLRCGIRRLGRLLRRQVVPLYGGGALGRR